MIIRAQVRSGAVGYEGATVSALRQRRGHAWARGAPNPLYSPAPYMDNAAAPAAVVPTMQDDLGQLLEVGEIKARGYKPRRTQRTL